MRILMLGNSLTTSHDLPQLLASILDAEVVVHARGGARLAEHLNSGTRLGAMTQDALANEHWDYVVMQEMSNAPVRSRDRFIESSTALCELVHGSGAMPVLYATWAHAPSCPKLEKLGVSYAEMHTQLVDAYHEAARLGDALVADVGEAFFSAGVPEALYAPDGVHPSEAGAELAAKTIARVLQGKS